MINTSDVVAFYGRSVEELKREMATSIEVHLQACHAKGVEPSRPYSGKFNVRLSPAEHAQIERRARADLAEFDRIVNRKDGEPPRPDDELPPDLAHLGPDR